VLPITGIHYTPYKVKKTKRKKTKDMKLSKNQITTLVDVLNAQSGVKPIEDKESYNEKLSQVAEFLNTKGGKTIGGITAEIYKDNKEVKELVVAAKAHLDKAKEREEKAKTKPTKEVKASKQKTEKSPKVASPQEEKARAKAIVGFINAVTGVKKLDAAEYSNAYNRSKKYLDFKKGGLLATAPEGKKSPWERFKDFPGVKDAAKAHREYVKNKSKDAPSQDMA
jgi:hypothetical protein